METQKDPGEMTQNIDHDLLQLTAYIGGLGVVTN